MTLFCYWLNARRNICSSSMSFINTVSFFPIHNMHCSFFWMFIFFCSTHWIIGNVKLQGNIQNIIQLKIKKYKILTARSRLIIQKIVKIFETRFFYWLCSIEIAFVMLSDTYYFFPSYKMSRQSLWLQFDMQCSICFGIDKTLGAWHKLFGKNI